MYYYSHHIGDFDRATRHLTRVERSIYLDLMFQYYESEKALTLDMAALCRKVVARSEEERAAVAMVLEEFFIETPSGYFHERCEEEIAHYRKTSNQASLAGKASAAARAARKEAALTGVSRSEERNINDDSTSVERPLNGRITASQREVNGSSTNQQPITNNQEPVTSKVKSIVPASAETLEVFTYWQQVMNHPQAKLDAKRDRAIKARLKDGYSVGDLCLAVDGCARSPHHMGQNDARTVYDDIELICRDGPRVDGFIKKAAGTPGPQRSNNQQQTLNNLQAYLEGTK